MSCTSHSKSQLATAALIAIAAGPSMATDFDVAGGRPSVSGSIFVGTVIRADDRDAELLPAPNAALVGAAVGGKNQDGAIGSARPSAPEPMADGVHSIGVNFATAQRRTESS